MLEASVMTTKPPFIFFSYSDQQIIAYTIWVAKEHLQPQFRLHDLSNKHILHVIRIRTGIDTGAVRLTSNSVYEIYGDLLCEPNGKLRDITEILVHVGSVRDAFFIDLGKFPVLMSDHLAETIQESWRQWERNIPPW